MNIQHLFPEISSNSLKGIISFVNYDTGIDEGVLEKDLFLTGMLRSIQSLPEIEKVYFKGGTCLSKCHHIIDRFSEDCDLFVYTGSKLASHTQEQRLNSRIVNGILDMFGAEQAKDENGNLIGKRGGDYNKLVFAYDKLFDLGSSSVKPNLEFEITSTALRDKTQYNIKSTCLSVQSIIGECLIRNRLFSECDRLGLNAFNVQCLLPGKALCDKISRMVRVSYNDSMMEDLVRYMRDIYDLGMLLRNEWVKEYLETKAILPDLFMTNIEDSCRSDSHSAESYGKARIFSSPKDIFSIPLIKKQYDEIIKSFVFDKEGAPKINEIIDSLTILHGVLELFDRYRISRLQEVSLKKNANNKGESEGFKLHI